MSREDVEALMRRGVKVASPAKQSGTKKRARAPYHSRCCACLEEFSTEAAEERHAASTTHRRYELMT